MSHPHHKQPIVRSVVNAVEGWAAASSERNMRIHLVIGTAVLLASAAARITRLEWAAVLLAMALVFCTELINTSIEAVVDLVSPEEHPLAKKAKDTAAGAVLVAALFAVIVGGIVFLPRLVVFVRP